MENRINQIVQLENNKKHVILNQAIYKGKVYYLASEITEDETEPTGMFTIFAEVEENNEYYLEMVKDKQLLELLVNYLQPKED